MSGHSKWSTIKHKKAAADSKRGKIFDRLNKEIIVAARAGGADTDSNSRLRTAISKARSVNMPSDNIKRAILKGTGDLPGVQIEEISYEGYGPCGVAVYIECMTDNHKRTVSEVRHIFSKYGGNLGENGSVSWMFNKKGMFVIENGDEEAIMEATLDAGAEDVISEDESVVVFCEPASFEAVQAALEAVKIETAVAEISMIANTKKELNETEARKVLKVIDLLEDCEDVQNVHANFDISDEILAAIEEE
jgi:YebC/PmpR family DNA-binding regulatory protein